MFDKILNSGMFSKMWKLPSACSNIISSTVKASFEMYSKKPVRFPTVLLKTTASSCKDSVQNEVFVLISQNIHQAFRIVAKLRFSIHRLSKQSYQCSRLQMSFLYTVHD